jgi:hypothetical protein
MSNRTSKNDIDAWNAALHDQSNLFTEDDVCRLTQNLPNTESERLIAESGNVLLLQMWIGKGFKVTGTMIQIATEHGNLAFLKTCHKDNSVKCDLKWVRKIAIQQTHSHIVEWLDGLESQP